MATSEILYGNWVESDNDQRWRIYFTLEIEEFNTSVRFKTTKPMIEFGQSVTENDQEESINFQGKFQYLNTESGYAYINESFDINTSQEHYFQRNKANDIKQEMFFVYLSNTDNSKNSTIIKTIEIPSLPSYSITYNANGAIGETFVQEKIYNTQCYLFSQNDVQFSKDGYTLYKWGTSSDGSGTNYDLGAAYSKNEDLTLYALWQSTVTYNANTGTGTMNSSSVISSITLPSNTFKKFGYKFSHWNTQPNGTGINYANGATYGGPDVTLYAQWKPWKSTLNTLEYQYGEEGNELNQSFHFGTTFDKVYDTLNHNFSLQDLAITLKKFFKKQAFMIYSENPPANNSKIMEWYALSGDTSDEQVDSFLVVNDSN